MATATTKMKLASPGRLATVLRDLLSRPSGAVGSLWWSSIS